MNEERVGAFAEQMLGALSGAATTAMTVVGDRLGLYRALYSRGPSTAGELADEASTSERYTREWLAQQAAAGVLGYDPETTRFTLPEEHAAVLAIEGSPAFLVGGAVITAGWFHGIDRLLSAFRTGQGIAWQDQDPAVFEGTARFFAPGYATNLTREWIPALHGVHEKLHAGATVADVGCGYGASTILIAQSYPESTVVGFDSHEPSIQLARKRAHEAGLTDRVRFEVADAAGYPRDGGYDLICLLDTLHDLGDPVAAAAHARRALAPDGVVMLVEPQAADDLSTNLSNPLAAISYAASTFQCVPASLAQPGQAALGAQAGESSTRTVMHDAGFTRFRRAVDTLTNAVFEARP